MASEQARKGWRHDEDKQKAAEISERIEQAADPEIDKYVQRFNRGFAEAYRKRVEERKAREGTEPA